MVGQGVWYIEFAEEGKIMKKEGWHGKRYKRYNKNVKNTWKKKEGNVILGSTKEPREGGNTLEIKL